MDDITNLLEQLQKYQHQNKHLLSENAKLHAKSKRLKMEKKQFKLQLQTHLQSNTHCIEHQTLQFVNHHHIEMQKMIDNLLSHPTIIQSSTYKDLQYIASKLSYIQSKVALATNGKTSTTSPPDLHSQRHHTLTRQQLDCIAPESIHTESDSSSYGSHRRTKKHKSKRDNKGGHTKQVPNLNMLASRSSPYKPSMNKTKPQNGVDSNLFDHNKIYHKRTRSASNKKQSIQQQLKQLEFDKYSNTNITKPKTRMSNMSNIRHHDPISPLPGPILSALHTPMHRKDRSTIISTSSMAVSRATSVVEDLESDLMGDIPDLPPTPTRNMLELIKDKHNTNSKRHNNGRKIKHLQLRPQYYEHPTTPNSGYSAYYENDTTPIRSMRLHVASMDTNEESIGNIDCMFSTKNSKSSEETKHSNRQKRAQSKHVLHSKKRQSNNAAAHAHANWYGVNKNGVLPMLSLTNPPSNTIKEEKEKRNAHKGSHSVAIKDVCVRPQLDINAVSLKLHSHANRSVPAKIRETDAVPSISDHILDRVLDKLEDDDGDDDSININKEETPNISDPNKNKSNSVIIHESQDSETTIESSNTTLSASSHSAHSLKKYAQRQTSLGHVNFVYDFQHNKGGTDSMQSFDGSNNSSCTDGVHLKSSHETQQSNMNLMSNLNNMNKVTRGRSPSAGSSSYPPTFHLDMNISDRHNTPTPLAMKIPSRHNQTQSNCSIEVIKPIVVNHSSQSTLATESEARVRSKWKINLNMRSRNIHSSSSSSISVCDQFSSDDEDNKDSMCSNSDGESDTYSESETTQNTNNEEYSMGAEGDDNSNKKYQIKINEMSRSRSCSNTINTVTSLSNEGVGDNDDFFDSSTNNLTPFAASFKLNENEFRPDPISPFGFSVNNKRSKTVSAMDMMSKSKRRKLLNKKFSIQRTHNNGVKKHSSFTYIDDTQKYSSVEQIKEEMIAEYKNNNINNKRRASIDLNEVNSSKHDSNHLSLPNFLSDISGDEALQRNHVRRLSVEEKEKLLMIDDLIASILNNSSSYLMTKALLLSYQAFTSSILLMKVLRRRFRVPHDYIERIRINNKNNENDDDDDEVIAFKIQLGISQLLYAWMHTYWEEDFVSHPVLQKEIYEFQNDIEKFIVDKSKSAVIYKLLQEPSRCKTNSLSESAESVSVSRIMHNNENENKLENVDIEIRTRWPHLMTIAAATIAVPDAFDILKYKYSEIAQQIVLMDYCVFREIRAREVVAQAWKKADKWERAQNLLRMINQFNSVCRWIQITILNYGNTVKHRARMIKHMICIANVLLEYQDFSALCAVHSALVSTPIKRLQKEWKKVNRKYIKMIEKISSLFEWNSPKLIELHLKSRGPIIPHLGIILKNVISIEESSEYKADGSINTHKMNLLAQQIELLMKWQRNCTQIYSNNASHKKINKVNKRFQIEENIVTQKLLLKDFEQQIHITEDDIYQMSKLCTN